MTTAPDLVDMLTRHYLPEGRPPGGLFAAEIGSPDGRRRADALWMPFTRAGGTGLVGHEIKVSRSDVLVELADPTKTEPWAQYCEHWWLVIADPALVTGLEIPAAWGIMSPPSGRRTRSMTIVRPAPKLHPMDPSPGLRRLLTWHFHRSTEFLNQVTGDLDYHKREVERLRANLAEASAGQPNSPQAQRVARILHAARKLAEDEGVWSVDDDVIARAIVDASAVSAATQSARRQLGSLLDRLADPLSYARTEVEKALAEVPS